MEKMTEVGMLIRLFYNENGIDNQNMMLPLRLIIINIMN